MYFPGKHDSKIKDQTYKCISTKQTVRAKHGLSNICICQEKLAIRLKKKKNGYQLCISKCDNKIKDQTIKCISAKPTIQISNYQKYISKPDNKVKIGISNVNLSIRSISDYQMYISKADDKIKIRLYLQI